MCVPSQTEFFKKIKFILHGYFNFDRLDKTKYVYSSAFLSFLNLELTLFQKSTLFCHRYFYFDQMDKIKVVYIKC